MARTLWEKVVDRLLALYAIDRCQTRHKVRTLSETKLQKLIFLSERNLIDSRCKALNYRFIKLLYPTYSEELENDLNNLTQLNFLDGPYYNRNRKAQMILDDFDHVFKRNREIMCSINDTLDEFAPIPTEKLVRMVCRMHWRRGTIDDLKLRTPLLYPLKEAKARCVFEIDEEDFEDLAICLSPRVSRGMEQAFDELRRGRRLTHAQVFG